MNQTFSPQPSLATRTFTIAAGGSVEYVRKADFLTCLAATATFAVSLDNQPQTEFESGLTYRPGEGVHKLEIINLSAVQELVVQLAFGRGNIQDNRTAFTGQLATKPASPDLFTTPVRVACPTAAATLVLAQDDQRAEAILFNDGAGRVYLQGAAGAAGVGVPLEPSQTAILTTTAAIYARNDTGAAVDVLAGALEFTP